MVLAHGGRFTKESWTSQAPILSKAGFRVLAIDFRGRGESRGGPTLGNHDDGVYLDVLAAVRFLRADGAKSISVVGASFGGYAAARAAAESDPTEIDRLVLLAASPNEQPERIEGRKLFIVARNDTTASGVPRLVSIRKQFDRAPPPKELVVVEGYAHAQFLFDTNESQRVMDEIVRFLSAP